MGTWASDAKREIAALRRKIEVESDAKCEIAALRRKIKLESDGKEIVGLRGNAKPETIAKEKSKLSPQRTEPFKKELFSPTINLALMLTHSQATNFICYMKNIPAI